MKIDFERTSIQISHPDKLIFPEDSLTKSDLVNYYAKISQHVLRYTRGRPISMQRFPDGIDSEGFYQKELPAHFPSWIESAEIHVKSRNESQRQVLINYPETLIYLVNFGMITPHIWPSKSDELEQPDRMIFAIIKLHKGNRRVGQSATGKAQGSNVSESLKPATVLKKCY